MSPTLLPATRSGRRNLLSDVGGLKVGNAEDWRVLSGVTVVLPDRSAVAAVAVAGGAPGSRETALLDPTCLVERVDALVIAGGSAFGLEAAAGVVDWLAAQGRGFRIGESIVPIVPSAILFDLQNGGDKSWGAEPPYRRLGAVAAAAAGEDFPLGNAGAGLGARAGALKGGLGSASAMTADGIEVGALAAVNCFGETVMPGTSAFWAWPFERNGELGAQRPAPDAVIDLDQAPAKERTFARQAGAHTTLGVVATNLALTKAEAQRVALMAQDGLARAIRPVHTPFDGDTVFALATGARACNGPADLWRAGALAADCLARAVARGVYLAEPVAGMPSYRTLYIDRPAAE